MLKPSKKVVLTGFESFANFNVNPSWEAIKEFEGKSFGSFKIKTFKIPLRYSDIKNAIARIIDAEKPSIIIGFGQSYRSKISLEKVAVNVADLTEATVLYNCGTRPEDETLESNAPAAYFATLPLRKILDALHKANILGEISYSAGTFGCNQIFFHVLHKRAIENLDLQAGFVHLPVLPSQAIQLRKAGRCKIPSMSLETMVKAVKIIVEAIIED